MPSGRGEADISRLAGGLPKAAPKGRSEAPNKL